MFDLNSNLVKEALTRQMKSQFEYSNEGEAPAETSQNRPSTEKPARKNVWGSIISFIEAHKLHEPKHSRS